MKTFTCKVEGMYVWKEGRIPHTSNYKLDVEVPMSERNRAINYIRNHAIDGLLRDHDERAIRHRSCHIVSGLPDPVDEDIDENMGEDLDIDAVMKEEGFDDLDPIDGPYDEEIGLTPVINPEDPKPVPKAKKKKKVTRKTTKKKASRKKAR